MNNTTQAGKRLERLRLDPDFRRLWYIAYKDKSRLEECINEARRLFNLSPIWGSAYLPIIFSEYPTDLIQINLNIPQPVEEKIDPITGATYYLMPIYPESTLNGIKEAYKSINAKYRAANQRQNVRGPITEQTKLQYRVFELHVSGKNHKEIAEIINDEFNTFYIKEDIPLLIQRAQKKSLR